jgi:hypothetical protein
MLPTRDLKNVLYPSEICSVIHLSPISMLPSKKQNKTLKNTYLRIKIISFLSFLKIFQETNIETT